MEPFIKLSRLSPLVVITEGMDSRASHAACLENQCLTSSRAIYRYSMICKHFFSSSAHILVRYWNIYHSFINLVYINHIVISVLLFFLTCRL